MKKIIYEPHPINPARKAKLQAQGYKIIDAAFAPAGVPLHEMIEVPEDDYQEEVSAVVEAAPEVVEEDDTADEALEDEEAEEAFEIAAPRKRGRKPKG